MKNKIFALSVLALILALSSGSFAADSGAPSLSVSVAKYEPFPAEAGQYLDVWFKVENTGSGTADDAAVEFLPKYPFSLDSNNAVKSLGTMPQGSLQLVQYRVRVDEKAASGDNILQLRYRASPLGAWATKDFTVFIQEHDAIMAIGDIQVPEMVPGKVQTISIPLQNMADAYLKDVAVMLDFSSATLPFAPINSINEKRISGIPPNGKTEFLFDIMAFPDASSGVYKIPMTVKYSDTTNKTYNRQYILGFVVNAAPDFSINIQKADAMTEGSAGEVTISVSNTGPSNIKFLSLYLLPSSDYEIISEGVQYLGNLNPDDYESGVFKIYINRGALLESKKTVPLKLSLKYRDGLNNEYSKDATLDLRIYTSSEISAYGIGTAGGGSSVIYLIIAAVVIYYLYRKYWRGKKKI